LISFDLRFGESAQTVKDLHRRVKAILDVTLAGHRSRQPAPNRPKCLRNLILSQLLGKHGKQFVEHWRIRFGEQMLRFRGEIVCKRRFARSTSHTSLRDQAIEAAPAWVLGKVQVGKLLIGLESIQQTFQGEQSNLARLELLFAPAPPATGHTIRFALQTTMVTRCKPV
jgi:hypothetical protein